MAKSPKLSARSPASDRLAEDIVLRRDALDADRGVWKQSWQEIADNLIPRKNQIQGERTKGGKRNQKRYSSSGQHAHSVLTAALHGTMSSSAVQWFNFTTGDTETDSIKEVRQFFDDAAKTLWRAFNRGNFHTQVHEAYLDVSGFGTSCILQEPDGVGPAMEDLVFTTFSIQDYVIEESSSGLVDTVYLTRHYTARQAIQKYGEENVAPKVLTDLVKDPAKRHPYIQVIAPDGDFDGVSAPDGMRYVSVHIDPQNKVTAAKSGYHEFPCAVPRWSQVAGETWGRGPADNALPDIKVLNEATRLELNAWAKALDPPLLVEEDGVAGGKIDMRPGKATVVRDMDRSLKAFESKARFDVNRIKLDEYRNEIRRAFFADQLELPTNSTMTATEVQVRFDLMQRILGPILGRLEYELQSPIIERGFNILFRAGKLGQMPSALIDALNRGGLSITYMGPLSRAQKQQEISGTLRWLESVAAVAQIDPASLDLVDMDEVQKFLHHNSEQPEQFLRTDKLVLELREARAKQQQKEDGLAEAQAGAGIASDIATAGASARIQAAA
tara:strand:- start:7673 stop:9340 length:1668 start_codon:yes stop_codon:yes gene_type:complete